MSDAPFQAELDHLVVWAASLEQGCAWCEATLGVAPGPGGVHPLMGTHNRLIRLEGDTYPRAYLEIIAINPSQPTPQPARAARWFDMDDERLRARVLNEGPQLTHLVARVPRLDAALAALRGLGIDRGEALAASRDTPAGPLKWRISVRPDGRRLFDGALPTLIEWDGPHPTQGMPHSSLHLEKLAIGARPRQESRADPIEDALGALGLGHWLVSEPGAPALAARLVGPRGPVTLTHS